MATVESSLHSTLAACQCFERWQKEVNCEVVAILGGFAFGLFLPHF